MRIFPFTLCFQCVRNNYGNNIFIPHRDTVIKGKFLFLLSMESQKFSVKDTYVSFPQGENFKDNSVCISLSEEDNFI